MLLSFCRFAAIDVSSEEFKDRAVTYVLTGGVLAAFLGPLSATYTQNLFPTAYVGSYLMMTVYAIVNQVILHYIEFPDITKGGHDEEACMRAKSVDDGIEAADVVEGDFGPPVDSGKDSYSEDEELKPPRPLFEIMRQPLFILACSTATIAHTVMVMFMAVFTIAMDNEGYGFSDIQM